MSLSASATGRASLRPGAASSALFATLLVTALHAAGGFPTLTHPAGDNDSLLRLVQVRDLIAGQGWYDLTQYRLGPEGGVVMHWSRLVDVPLVAIILAGSLLTGSPAWGEAVALVLWPAILFFAALYLLLRATHRLAGAETLLPCLVIGATALHYAGVFAPGAIDHHNVQVVLTLALVTLLLEASGRDGMPIGAAAGACAAPLLAIAMEGAPYVAMGGAVVTLLFLLDPTRSRRTAIGYGLAFGGVATAIFIATVRSDAWAAVQCDAYSLPQFALAAAGGLGLAAVAARGAHASFVSRLAALAVLAASIAGIAALGFPQCFADPYAGLDPRLKRWWLSAVTEAQPLWKILKLDPAMAAGHYATPALAMIYLAAAAWRRGITRDIGVVAAFLVTAFAVSIWQVRGSMFAIPLAVIPLSVMVSDARLRAAKEALPSARIGMLAAWLLSFNVLWSGSVGALARAAATNDIAGALPGGAPVPCGAAADFEALAGLRATTVMTVSNLGMPVLRHTHHRVLAGPYHRNVEGNLAVLDAFAGLPTDAPAVPARHQVGIVAVCPGDDESKVVAQRAPHGLLAMLLRGEIPRWLEPLPQTRTSALQLFRVLSPNGPMTRL